MYGEKKQIANSRIVRERDRDRFRELFSVLSLGLPVGIFLLVFTWQNLEVIRLGSEATRLRKIRKELVEGNRNFQLELERLTALGTVEARALTLGLRPTEPSRIVRVSVGGLPVASPAGVDISRSASLGVAGSR